MRGICYSSVSAVIFFLFTFSYFHGGSGRQRRTTAICFTLSFKILYNKPFFLRLDHHRIVFMVFGCRLSILNGESRLSLCSVTACDAAAISIANPTCLPSFSEMRRSVSDCLFMKGCYSFCLDWVVESTSSHVRYIPWAWNTGNVLSEGWIRTWKGIWMAGMAIWKDGRDRISIA
jgi:hypothetical protein